MKRSSLAVVSVTPSPQAAPPAVKSVIGPRARALRLRKKLTQRQIATVAHVTTNTVRGFEKGSHQTRYSVAQRIVRALDTTLEALESEDYTDGDPRLQHLSSEDLDVATRYHHGSTELRLDVQRMFEKHAGETSTPPEAFMEALLEVCREADDDTQTQILSVVKALRRTEQTRRAAKRRERRENGA